MYSNTPLFATAIQISEADLTVRVANNGTQHSDTETLPVLTVCLGSGSSCCLFFCHGDNGIGVMYITKPKS